MKIKAYWCRKCWNYKRKVLPSELTNIIEEFIVYVHRVSLQTKFLATPVIKCDQHPTLLAYVQTVGVARSKPASHESDWFHMEMEYDWNM